MRVLLKSGMADSVVVKQRALTNVTPQQGQAAVAGLALMLRSEARRLRPRRWRTRSAGCGRRNR